MKKRLLIVGLLAVLALGAVGITGCKEEAIPIRKLNREEVAKLGISVPEKGDKDNYIIGESFDAFSVDVDNDDREEIVVYARSYDKEYFHVYQKQDSSYKLFQELEMVLNDLAYIYSSLEIMDLDNNGFADLLLRSSTGGSGGGGQISIYEWNGNKFTIATAETEKWIEMEDVNGDGRLELINWTYLDSSLDGYPSSGGMVLWPDIQTYSSGRIVTANEQFPDYYKKLYREKATLLDNIKAGTIDESTLRHKDYYNKTGKEIMRRCRPLMK